MRIRQSGRLLIQLAMLLLPWHGAAAQCQLEKLLPPNPIPDEWFGSAVTTDGSLAAISELGQGKVHAYENVGGIWTLTQSLDVVTALFGTPLAISGEWLAVGNPTDSPLGAWLAGSVSMYRREAGMWVFKAKLTGSDNQSFAQFGGAVAMAGDTLIVGAANYSILPSGHLNGAVYIFSLQGVNWLQTTKLIPSQTIDDSMFGYSLSVDGTRLAVGALSQNSLIAESVFVFDHSNGQWVESARLQASDGSPGDYFGYSITLQSDVLIVGSPKHATGTCCPDGGAVYVFLRNSSGWHEHQQLRAADPSNGEFGTTLTLSLPELVVGCPHDNDHGISGSAYYFRNTDLGWIQQGKVLPKSPSKPIAGGSSWGLGTCIALGRGGLLSGAPNDTAAIPPGGVAESGALYVFQLATSASQYCSCVVQAPCGNPDGHGGCYSSSGQGAVLQACGSGSVTTDDLKMESRWMPKDVRGLVLMGPRADKAPYGDGNICVGPGDKGLFRYPAGSSGPEGVITLGPGIVAYSHANFPTTGHIQPGDTWYFQAWYRDPNGPCGTGFNLSNGLKVEFTQ
jgi:FG-GAP repeat